MNAAVFRCTTEDCKHEVHLMLSLGLRRCESWKFNDVCNGPQRYQYQVLVNVDLGFLLKPDFSLCRMVPLFKYSLYTI